MTYSFWSILPCLYPVKLQSDDQSSIAQSKLSYIAFTTRLHLTETFVRLKTDVLKSPATSYNFPIPSHINHSYNLSLPLPIKGSHSANFFANSNSSPCQTQNHDFQWNQNNRQVQRGFSLLADHVKVGRVYGDSSPLARPRL